MIKRISLVTRRPDLTMEEFERHWLGPHVDIIRQMPQVRGYTINVVQDATSTCEWDGIAEVWFDSMDAAREAFEAEPIRSLLAVDRPQFLSRIQVLFVAEHIVKSLREREE